MWLLKAGSPSIKPKLESKLDHLLEPDKAGQTKIKYAILSHRWEDDGEEVDFAEVASGIYDRTRQGAYKIDNCREQASRDGLEYVWIDTCCIDKRSSAELQESINSMYRWYERAAVCYVYLRDVDGRDFDRTFPRSEWFTRGWTLQELIAPANLRFYDRDWCFLGDKSSLSSSLSKVTGISTDILVGKKHARDCSVAQRMFWASKRKMTRIEDMAYSLLGIFDVNMPLLYGEREKAFFRLQEEIIKTSYDHSIFAWVGLQHGRPGLLATSVEAFQYSDGVEKVRLRHDRQPFSMTNRGLTITLSLLPWSADTYLATLNCAFVGSRTRWGEQELMGIFVRQLYEDDQYARVQIGSQQLLTNARTLVERAMGDRQLSTIHVAQGPIPEEEHHYLAERVNGFRLDRGFCEQGFVVGYGIWDPAQKTLTLDHGNQSFESMAIIDIAEQGRRVVLVRLGFDRKFRPVILLAERSAIGDRESNRLHPFWSYNDLEHDTQNPGFSSSWPDDDTIGWNRISVSLKFSLKFDKTQRIVQDHETIPGLWLVKGDRIDGLDVYLADGEDGGKGTHVQLTRAMMGKEVVWDLPIRGLPRESVPGTTHAPDVSSVVA